MTRVVDFVLKNDLVQVYDLVQVLDVVQVDDLMQVDDLVQVDDLMLEVELVRVCLAPTIVDPPAVCSMFVPLPSRLWVLEAS